jgi:starch phosphorylase
LSEKSGYLLFPQDAAALYDKPEQAVIPLFYHDVDRFINVMRQPIALDGSFFNAHRMLQ